MKRLFTFFFARTAWTAASGIGVENERSAAYGTEPREAPINQYTIFDENGHGDAQSSPAS